jgi:hypothetical protein
MNKWNKWGVIQRRKKREFFMSSDILTVHTVGGCNVNGETVVILIIKQTCRLTARLRQSPRHHCII